MGSDCISSRSLLIFLLWVENVEYKLIVNALLADAPDVLYKDILCLY